MVTESLGLLCIRLHDFPPSPWKTARWDMDNTGIDTEIELLQSSLLPAEQLETGTGTEWPRIIDISSEESKLALRITVKEAYPERESVAVDIRGPDIGREEAEGWRAWSAERLKEWNAEEGWVSSTCFDTKAVLTEGSHCSRSSPPTSYLF